MRAFSLHVFSNQLLNFNILSMNTWPPNHVRFIQIHVLLHTASRSSSIVRHGTRAFVSFATSPCPSASSSSLSLSLIWKVNSTHPPPPFILLVMSSSLPGIHADAGGKCNEKHDARVLLLLLLIRNRDSRRPVLLGPLVVMVVVDSDDHHNRAPQPRHERSSITRSGCRTEWPSFN